MIPILYTADETRFITNGIGRLTSCIRCIVTEERNGIYECEFDYPITGAHFDDIEIGRIVVCTHDNKGDIQPFVIYQRSVPDLRGVVTFYAHHISYRLNGTVVMPFTAESVMTALQGIETNSVNSNPFTFWTDKTTTATFESTVPRLARNMLGGEENSILDVFGTGDYEFDKFDVKLHAHRGVDSDVEIRYSKNLIDLSETIDDSGSYNAIVPYWADADGNIVTLPEKMIVYSGVESQRAYLTDHNLIIIRTETNEPIEVAFSRVIAVPMDMSDYFDTQPTVSQLRTAAESRFLSSQAWLPIENLKVDFVQLWQTEEYKDYAALQRVGLCDTVSVYYPSIGIAKVKQRVIRVVYNVLLDRYDSVELGQIQASLGQSIREDILQEVPTTSMMQSAIEYATDLIRGGLGGYVVMTSGENGYPQEILIMDTPDVNTAVNVWRFNQGGLGHSSNGYNGPFSDIALTQDGKINASMITTGYLNANRIKAGIISDEEGNNSWNLSSGEFVTTSGKIADFDISRSGIYLYDQWLGFNSLGLDYLSVFTAGRTVNGQMGVRYIQRTEMRSGRLLFMGKYNASTPPTNWNDYDQIATFYGQYDDDGNQEFRLQMGSFDSVPLYFNSSENWEIKIGGDTYIYGSLGCSGTKPRIVKTPNYGERLNYCYETPTPLFGDIGEAQLDADGICYVDIDDIFSETIELRQEYQVFLQEEGEGDCWVADKQKRYFVIKGTPNLKVAWELKAKQRDYDMLRLEQFDNNLDEYKHGVDDITSLDTFIIEQEELLYG